METCLTDWALLIFVGFMFVLGFLATILPVLPSGLIVFTGVLVHTLFAQTQLVSWNFVIFVGVLVVISQILDWALSYWGVKKFGGTWRGGVGAILGMIIGAIVLTPFIGLIVGPIIGAVVGELIGGNGFHGASRAGLGTVVGGLLAFGFKVLVVFIVIAGFVYNAYYCV